MLATPADANDLPSSQHWAYEMKWDGVRAVCYLAGGQTKILSRRGRDVTASYPEIAEALAELQVTDAVLDGEIVAPDENKRPSFALLQQRMNLEKSSDIAQARRSAPVQLVLFDVMHRDGRSLVKDRYRQRRAELETLTGGAGEEPLVDQVGRIQIPPVFDGDLPAALDASQTLGLEGVVAKKVDSVYQPGARGRTWVKIKNVCTQEVVVAGWLPGQGRRSEGVGSLVMAVPAAGPADGDATDGGPVLRYAGRVGTGFSDTELDRLHGQFAAVGIDYPEITDVPALDARHVHWIEPVWVGEVTYAEWTPDHRLRSPVWRGWRPDKSPGDIETSGPPVA